MKYLWTWKPTGDFRTMFVSQTDPHPQTDPDITAEHTGSNKILCGSNSTPKLYMKQKISKLARKENPRSIAGLRVKL